MDGINISELKQRTISLYDAMIADPDRPFWQAELTACVLNLAEVMSFLSSDLAATAGDLESIKKRLDSLEHRYSQLLYKMAER